MCSSRAPSRMSATVNSGCVKINVARASSILPSQLDNDNRHYLQEEDAKDDAVVIQPEDHGQHQFEVGRHDAGAPEPARPTWRAPDALLSVIRSLPGPPQPVDPSASHARAPCPTHKPLTGRASLTPWQSPTSWTRPLRTGGDAGRRQPRCRQMWPRRCALPVASGCRPDVAGGRLHQLAAPPGAPSRATSSSSAAVNSRSICCSARAAAAAAAASSKRRRGVACGVARRRKAARGGAVQAAAARAAAARTLAESAWVARTPRAPHCSGRASCVRCMSRLYALCLCAAYAHVRAIYSVRRHASAVGPLPAVCLCMWLYCA